MKKIKKIILILVLVVIIIVGMIVIINTNSVSKSDTEKTNTETGKITEIKENMFMTQINDVYINKKEYVGKTIKIEGFVRKDEYDDKTFYAVVRRTPGCCGDDGMTGLEFYYDKDMPEANEWIQVIGTIELSKDINGDDYPVIKATNVTVKEERGLELVQN